MPHFFFLLLLSFFLHFFLSSKLLSQQTAMNPYEEESSFCYLHPKEFLVGICALCLKERLLSLAANQSHVHLPKEADRVFRGLRRKPPIALPKVFALGSFFHRSDARTQKPDEENNEGSVTSLEDYDMTALIEHHIDLHTDSFISIKFEADGRGSWESLRKSSEGQSWLVGGRGGKLKEINGRINSAVEKAKLHGGLRWRKRIGQLIQLARWNRSSKAGASHAGIVRKVERVRGRRGWIRSLTRRTISATE